MLVINSFAKHDTTTYSCYHNGRYRDGWSTGMVSMDHYKIYKPQKPRNPRSTSQSMAVETTNNIDGGSVWMMINTNYQKLLACKLTYQKMVVGLPGFSTE